MHLASPFSVARLMFSVVVVGLFLAMVVVRTK
jgi:hypothetical protein